MVDRKSWEEFRESGLLWFINIILHTFGWSIVVSIDNNKIIEVYPARVSFRGFDQESNIKGYIKVSEYLKENIDDLVEESKS